MNVTGNIFSIWRYKHSLSAIFIATLDILFLNEVVKQLLYATYPIFTISANCTK